MGKLSVVLLLGPHGRGESPLPMGTQGGGFGVGALSASLGMEEPLKPFFLLFRERTVAQPPSKGVESGGAVATHVDPLCMRGTNEGLTAEKSP